MPRTLAEEERRKKKIPANPAKISGPRQKFFRFFYVTLCAALKEAAALAANSRSLSFHYNTALLAYVLVKTAKTCMLLRVFVLVCW